MFTGELYPYQVQAADRILKRHSLLVAYSMGLGKTPITINATEDLLETGKADRVLIVCPASLKWQWAVKLAEFTDLPQRVVKVKDVELTVPVAGGAVVVDGTKEERRRLWRYPSDYTIASYQALLSDWNDCVMHIPFDVMVCDEATALKNFRSKTSKLIKRLQPEYRIALAGAPVENRPEELYSIMQWVDDEVLGRWDLFDKSFIVRNGFGGVLRYKNLDLLHENLTGAMVRKSRRDADVAPWLPDVAENDVYVKLDPATRSVYKRIEYDLSEALAELNAAGSHFEVADFYAGRSQEMSAGHGKVMSRMQALQLLVDHPSLLRTSAMDHKLSGGDRGSSYAADLLGAGVLEAVLDKAIPPKLARTIELVADMVDEGGKIIVFTQFRRMLTILEHHLIGRNARAVLYHGGLSPAERAAAASRFQNDPDCRLFISSDAGGYGLDLPAANYLINYDLPYSNGKRQQRNHRHVRASSKHEKVYVVNLICEGTIETRVRSILDVREQLSSAVIDGGVAEVVNDVASLTEHVSSHR